MGNRVAKNPEEITDPIELKDQGNWHFTRAEYDDAIANYTRGLSILNENWKSEERPMNVHKIQKDEKILRSALLKNQAACLMKREEYQAAVLCCTRSLAYTPNDTKALYRRILALEHMNNLSTAYKE